MSSRIEEFREGGCEVIGISTDSVETHQRWVTLTRNEGGIGALNFPLASDCDGAVSSSYGTYIERQQVALRGVFLIDPNGVLQYQLVHSLNVGRSTDELLRVLDALQSGGLCPADRQVGQATIDVRTQLGPNRVIGQYRIESELGQGAFGTVYRARDETLNRTVALKVLKHESTESNQSLLGEARAAAALNHPSICTIYGVEMTDSVPVIAMEYVDGESLASRLSSGPIDAKLAENIILQAVAGMTSAHRAGVVHGDLKPANLMITVDDSVRIMDFGMARRISGEDVLAETMISGSLTDTGFTGTPLYMAPECVIGEPTSPASDVFSLGLVLFEMLAGHPAVSGRNLIEVLRNVEQFEMPDEIGTFPGHLQDFLRSALQVRPQDRASAEDLVSQLA